MGLAFVGGRGDKTTSVGGHSGTRRELSISRFDQLLA